MRRRGLNRIGILAVALILALGAMGVAYSAWVDEIYIEGSLYTGDINASVTCGGACSEALSGIPMDVPDTSASCSPTIYPMKLSFSVTNALPDVTYACSFNINNLDVDPFDQFESLPIKIDSVTLTPQGTYTGITASVIDLPSDPQIDPGQSAGGTVFISVAPDAPTSPTQNPAYTLEVTVVRWNE